MRAALLALLLLLATGARSEATTCAFATPRELMEGARLVFRGTVTNVQYPADGGTVATFEVATVLKGAVAETVDIYMEQGPELLSPGVPAFAVGEGWHVYAGHHFRHGWITGPCRGTQRISLPGETLPIMASVPVIDPTPGVVAAGAVLALAAVVAILWRRRAG